MEATVFLAQKPLRASYRATPGQAMVTDHARTGNQQLTDPFRTSVQPMDGCGIVVPIGTHAALGGPHDSPTPGDMLCAALAACQDSAFRMVANLLGIEITRLEVRVTASADVRGAMAMDPGVPVGFQVMSCEVDYSVSDGTPAAMRAKLEVAAQRCCVVQQTLKTPPEVRTVFSPTVITAIRPGASPAIAPR
ncbi:MAG: OsmC family protein [Burkholderiaceae bacterium]